MSEEMALAKQAKAVAGAGSSTKLVVPLILFATVTVFCNMYTTQPVLPVIGKEFGLSPAEAGLTVSALVLAIAASSLFYGLLSDRIGRKPVMVASVLVLALPTLLCAFAPSFGLLVLFRAGQGLLIPGYTAITITYLQEEIPAGRRGLVMGYYVSATVAGGFFGRLAGGLVTDLADTWRASFVFFALVDVGLAWVLWRMLPASRNFIHRYQRQEQVAAVVGAETVTVGRFNPAGVLVHLGNRRLVGTYIIGFSLMYSFLGLFTYLPYYLNKPPFNLSTILISSAYVVYLVGMFSAPLSARYADKVGRRRVITAGFALMLVGVLLTLTPALPVVIGGLVVICFGMFACQSNATSLVGESLREGSGRGSAVSLYQVFFYVGGSCGGFVPGLFWQTGGWPFVVGGVFVALTIGLMAVVWLSR